MAPSSTSKKFSVPAVDHLNIVLKPKSENDMLQFWIHDCTQAQKRADDAKENKHFEEVVSSVDAMHSALKQIILILKHNKSPNAATIYEQAKTRVSQALKGMKQKKPSVQTKLDWDNNNKEKITDEDNVIVLSSDESEDEEDFKMPPQMYTPTNTYVFSYSILNHNIQCLHRN